MSEIVARTNLGIMTKRRSAAWLIGIAVALGALTPSITTAIIAINR